MAVINEPGTPGSCPQRARPRPHARAQPLSVNPATRAGRPPQRRATFVTAEGSGPGFASGPLPAARAGGGVTGPAVRFAATGARILPGRFGQMQAFVADQAGPAEARAPIAGRRLDQASAGVPVEADQALALAPPDQQL